MDELGIESAATYLMRKGQFELVSPPMGVYDGVTRTIGGVASTAGMHNALSVAQSTTTTVADYSADSIATIFYLLIAFITFSAFLLLAYFVMNY